MELDKTDLYNKIINAIDVMGRIKGLEVVKTYTMTRHPAPSEICLKLGDIEVSQKHLHKPQVFIKDFNVSQYLDDNHRKVILNVLERLALEKVEREAGEKMNSAVSYLNSFIE